MIEAEGEVRRLEQILCVASPGWGKGCIRFCGRIWDLIVSVPDYCLSFYFD